MAPEDDSRVPREVAKRRQRDFSIDWHWLRLDDFSELRVGGTSRRIHSRRLSLTGVRTYWSCATQTRTNTIANSELQPHVSPGYP
jgi:hypothetical protein